VHVVSVRHPRTPGPGIGDRVRNTKERVPPLTNASEFIVVGGGEFSAQKRRKIKTLFARDWIAEREGARLPYSTLTGEHQVCITRKGNPAP